MGTSELDRMVAATPASRDRVVDFLRAASIVAVVFGHWFVGRQPDDLACGPGHPAADLNVGGDGVGVVEVEDGQI